MSGIEFSKNQRLALYALIGLSVIGLSYGHVRRSLGGRSGDVVFREAGGNGARVVTSGSDQMPGARDDRSGKVCAHVTGCVNAPGVYYLPAGSRVIDAIKAAGGAKPNADTQAINLAARIADGSQINLPAVQMSGANPSGQWVSQRPGLARRGPSANSTSGGAASTGDKLRNPGEGLVHINSAGIDELQRLPGVGPATAQKIFDYRCRLGRFSRPEQLIDVSGIGPRKFEKMRPFVAL